MKQTEMRFNLYGLEEIKEKVGRSYRARVGIIGGKAQKAHAGGITNVMLGIIQMFGSISRNIPARDFLLMPLVKKHRELMQAFNTTSLRTAFANGDYKKMFQLLGVAGEQIVQEGFETGGYGQWPDIKEETKKRKGSSAILIDTQQLRRAIGSDVVNQAGTPQTGNSSMVAP